MEPSDQEPFPGYGCNSPGGRGATRSLGFFVCPAHFRSRAQLNKCGSWEDAYCARWGCESTWWTNWSPPHPPVTGDMRAVGISQVACEPCYDKEQFPSHPWVTARDHCNLLVISLTEQGGQEG